MYNCTRRRRSYNERSAYWFTSKTIGMHLCICQTKTKLIPLRFFIGPENKNGTERRNGQQCLRVCAWTQNWFQIAIYVSGKANSHIQFIRIYEYIFVSLTLAMCTVHSCTLHDIAFWFFISTKLLWIATNGINEFIESKAFERHAVNTRILLVNVFRWRQWWTIAALNIYFPPINKRLVLWCGFAANCCTPKFI